MVADINCRENLRLKACRASGCELLCRHRQPVVTRARPPSRSQTSTHPSHHLSLLVSRPVPAPRVVTPRPGPRTTVSATRPLPPPKCSRSSPRTRRTTHPPARTKSRSARSHRSPGRSRTGSALALRARLGFRTRGRARRGAVLRGARVQHGDKGRPAGRGRVLRRARCRGDGAGARASTATTSSTRCPTTAAVHAPGGSRARRLESAPPSRVTARSATRPLSARPISARRSVRVLDSPRSGRTDLEHAQRHYRKNHS